MYSNKPAKNLQRIVECTLYSICCTDVCNVCKFGQKCIMYMKNTHNDQKHTQCNVNSAKYNVNSIQLLPKSMYSKMKAHKKAKKYIQYKV